MSDYVTIRCIACGGVAHPACGAEYAPGVVACGPCVRSLWRGILTRQAMRPRGGGPSFYDHVNRVAPVAPNDVHDPSRKTRHGFDPDGEMPAKRH